MSLLFYPDEFTRVVAALLQILQYLAALFGGKLWGAAQYPQVLGTAAPHHGVGVVWCKVQYIIVAIEGAEEAHLQLSGLSVLLYFGFAGQES